MKDKQVKEVKRIKNPGRFAAFVTIATFLGGYGWMILCNMSIQVYETQRLGSMEAGQVAANAIVSNNTVFAFVAYVGMEIIMLFIAYIMVKKYEGRGVTLQDFGLEPGRKAKKQFILGKLLGIGVFSFALILYTIFEITELKGINFSGLNLSQGIGTILIILIGMTFAAFCEEVVYRGIIQNYLMKKFTLLKAIALSTLCFSLMHIGRYSDIITLIYILFPGLVFGYLFAKTKSLYMSIGMHFSWNVLCALLGKGKTVFNTPYVVILKVMSNNAVLYKGIASLSFFLVFLGVWLYFRKKEASLKVVENTVVCKGGKQQ